MSSSGSMSYSETILLYLYANHLLQKGSVLEFYLNILKVVALRVLTDDVVTIVISHES